MFILNDNEKITRLLRELLAIYSRSIKKLKLKYFLRYYYNTILTDYNKYQKLNNMFKKKKTMYQKHSKNNNLKDLDKNNPNFRTINIPYHQSYLMNSSEPIILKPSNDNIAFLMTPCFIVNNNDNDNDVEYKTIKDYRHKFTNNNINKSLTSRHKFESKRESLNNSMKKIFDYTNSYSISEKRNNKTNGVKNNMKKIFFPYTKSELYRKNNENNSIKKIGNKRIKSELKRPVSTESIKKKKYNNILNYFKKNENDYLYKNNKKNNLILGEDNYLKVLQSKIAYKNKNKSCVLNGLHSALMNKTKDKNDMNNINREIFSNLYNNNYIKNLKKIDNEKLSKEKKNKRKRMNIFGINTERMQKKNINIFNGKENINPNYLLNDSHDYLFNKSSNYKNKHPYNKVIKNEMFSTSNYSLNNSSRRNKNSFTVKDMKKISKDSILNIYSNNSNSRTQNQNLNQSSTNYTSGPFNKENQKINKDQKKENSKKKNLQNESGFKGEYYKDSSDKNSIDSNRISLQTISDSKILELAGYYEHEDSSCENYQMNNILYNRKKHSKK